MHIPLRMLLCSGWNRCTLELLFLIGTRKKVLTLVKFAKRGGKKRSNLPHLVHCNPTKPSTNKSIIWTQGLDGTINFDSGASLCSLKVHEKTGPSGLPRAQGICLHFCLKTIPYQGWEIWHQMTKKRGFFCF